MKWTFAIAVLSSALFVISSASSSFSQTTTLIDQWTRTHSGCKCSQDDQSMACPCCVEGACQCGVFSGSRSGKCARCDSTSFISDCSTTTSQSDNQPTDSNGWTGRMECPCPEKTPTRPTTCACCVNNGCRCNDDPYQCTQCGREDECLVKPATNSMSSPGDTSPHFSYAHIDSQSYPPRGDTPAGTGGGDDYDQSSDYRQPTTGGDDDKDQTSDGGNGQTNGGSNNYGNYDYGAGGDGYDQQRVTRPPLFLSTSPTSSRPHVYTSKFINQIGLKCVTVTTCYRPTMTTMATPTTTTTTPTTTPTITTTTSITTSPTTLPPTGPTWIDRPNGDCSTLAATGTGNGVHEIHPSRREPFDTYCLDGWTVIQSRLGPEEDFDRDWQDYKTGFGDPSTGNYWVGLENIYHLTNSRRYRLRVVLKTFGHLAYWIEYDHFFIESETEGYRLHIEGLSQGNAGDGFRSRGFGSRRFHNGMKFSTKDRDNDNSGISCARKYRSGWWFNNCFNANLNGMYMSPRRKGGRYAFCGENGCVAWLPIHNRLSMEKVSMMIKLEEDDTVPRCGGQSDRFGQGNRGRCGSGSSGQDVTGGDSGSIPLLGSRPKNTESTGGDYGDYETEADSTESVEDYDYSQRRRQH